MPKWTTPIERLASTRAGAWFFVHVAMPVDRRLMPLTRGRVRLALVQPSGLLTCRGAKSGAERTIPLVYVPLSDDRIALVASNGGSPRHPAWFHNLRANPDVEFTINGRRRPYRARLTEGDERRRLWEQAGEQYLGYEVYQSRTAGREIGVFVLDPR